MKQSMLIATLACTLLLAACESEKVELLKSPCVGLDASPCGPKRAPVNNWVAVESATPTRG